MKADWLMVLWITLAFTSLLALAALALRFMLAERGML